MDVMPHTIQTCKQPFLDDSSSDGRADSQSGLTAEDFSQTDSIG
jgi:hypothetical protein